MPKWLSIILKLLSDLLGAVGDEPKCPKPGCPNDGGDCNDPECPKKPEDPGDGDEEEIDDTTELGKTIVLINELRRKQGVHALKANSSLNDAADKHAQWMLNNNILGHTGENNSRPSDRANAAGYDWNNMGENIGKNFQTPAAMVDGWTKSNRHYSIMMSSLYMDIGVGVASDDTGSKYWVAMFGSTRMNQNNVADGSTCNVKTSGSLVR